jgi:acyl carrier protein
VATVEELKELMLKIGIKESVVSGLGPSQPIAGRAMDSADYPAFLVAVEERYGVDIDDRYALRLKSMKDFIDFINSSPMRESP